MERLKKKKVCLIAIKQNLDLDHSSSSQSAVITKMFFYILCMMGELERYFISERTKSALRMKKAIGMRLGCPPGSYISKYEKFRKDIILVKSLDSS